MKLIKTWRWFDPEDPVSLKDIRQIGVEGIVTSLLHIPVGEVWSNEEISQRKKLIENSGFPYGWHVVESVNIHESIKTGSPDRERYIENYKKTIENLSRQNIRTICYNFMPVLDWERTDYQYQLDDGRETIFFGYPALAAFDLFILKRKGAENDYSSEMLKEAEKRFAKMTSAEKEVLSNTAMGALPGELQGN